MCREGLVRLCSERYAPPTKANLRDAYKHLTNYSLNKRNKVGYVHTAAGASASSGGDGDGGGQDEGEGGGECSGGGSKRKLSEVLPALVAASGGKLTEEVGMWEIDGRSRRGRGRPAATSTCDTLALH